MQGPDGRFKLSPKKFSDFVLSVATQQGVAHTYRPTMHQEGWLTIWPVATIANFFDTDSMLTDDQAKFRDGFQWTLEVVTAGPAQ